MTPLATTRILLSMLSLFMLVSSHGSRKREHYSFKDLRETVDGDSLSSEDQLRLFDRLKLMNCTEPKSTPDYRQCFTPKDLHDIDGSPPSKALNATEFQEISPVILFCLLPARERNSGNKSCDVYPKNHSELFTEFVKNFNKGRHGINIEALDLILKAINKTIGEFLIKKKCFSAKSIFNEVKDEEHEQEEHGHAHEEHHGAEEKSLDQHDFERASASIIFHLVQGFCIEEGHAHNGTESKLPSKEFFLEEIFGNKTHLLEENLEKITKVLGIGEKSAAASSGDKHSDHAHKHRRRRSTDFLSELKLLKSHSIHRRAVDSHGHESGANEHHATEAKCYSLDDMLAVFGIDHSTGADRYDFQQICPAFIQQVTSEACKADQSHQSTSAPMETEKHMGKIWGYGIAAVTVISLTSLAGVATLPLLGKRVYKKILALLVALAVGTLSGDAVLHLLPHAFGLHAHESEGTSSDGHADHSAENAFLWKAVVVLASIYSFFLFEILMHLGLMSKLGLNHGHSHFNAEVPGPPSRHISFKGKRNCSKFEHHERLPSFDKSDEKEKAQVENGDIVLRNVEGNKNSNSSASCSFYPQCLYEHVFAKDTEEIELFEAAKGGLDDHPNGVSKRPPGRMSVKSSLSRASIYADESGKKSWKKISTVAWVIIIGDTLHNLSDGLAIGAVFSEGGNSGVSGGISTSIAIFCHELPHELGDFAVLLTAGMSVKEALLANFLSALSCYIGLVIGIYVGQEGEVRFWIFAIAGGVFLYVALVDMLPELMHSDALQTDPIVTFLLQNLGLLLGFGIMLIIVLYEEDLMAIKF
ncbi:metal cation symporter ZIP14-like isoform X1 [Acropora palmata]|uniref:metal cation symporter ZIP14-like isoform X1 n=1 Tax=Acropora palmata TaxID=6131 RepID=UPI003D9FC782